MWGTKPLPTFAQSGPTFTAATTNTSMHNPPYPNARSIHWNDVTQMITASETVASRISQR